MATCPRTPHLCSTNAVDVLVTYDIADTQGEGASRLRRIADICGKYGQRVQFSVFECRLSAVRLARLIAEVEDVMDSRRDSVFVYRFPGKIADSTRRLGKGPTHQLGRPWML